MTTNISGNYQHYIDVYRNNVRKLCAQGVCAICYNFMPALDWARTDLYITQADGSTIAGCNIDAFVAFDLFELRRTDAAKDYAPWAMASARQLYGGLRERARAELHPARPSRYGGKPRSADLFAAAAASSAC